MHLLSFLLQRTMDASKGVELNPQIPIASFTIFMYFLVHKKSLMLDGLLKQGDGY